MYLTIALIFFTLPLALLLFWGLVSGAYASFVFITDGEHKKNFMTKAIEWLLEEGETSPETPRKSFDDSPDPALMFFSWLGISLLWPLTLCVICFIGFLFGTRYLHRRYRKEKQ